MPKKNHHKLSKSWEQKKVKSLKKLIKLDNKQKPQKHYRTVKDDYLSDSNDDIIHQKTEYKK